MSRKLTPNRWNWDDETKKWIFIKIHEDGRKIYHYRDDPPQEFLDLTMKLKKLNEKLIITRDNEENERLFKEMMKITKRIQNMRKEDPEEDLLQPL